MIGKKVLRISNIMVRLAVRLLTSARNTYFRNFPQAYIDREMGVKRDPAYKPRTYRNTEHRPWAMQEKNLNHPRNKIPPQKRLVHAPLPEWEIFQGDMVQVLVGKDKGRRGEVVQTVQERNWCFVGGRNLTYEKYAESSGIPAKLISKELPLDVVTEVALLDPVDNEPTKIEWRYTEQGDRVRVSKRTGRIIPIPHLAMETYEYKTKSTYREEPKDTRQKELSEVTYVPTSKTFEEEIMDKMGIVETRKQGGTFWY
ncbi:putative 39S ribosomal protein L24, mitochondrial [Hypsibius exemplaris]|uniref:Large ribosomal subunit protein uL24m n=1 Tax=Hypsibius exemplaris TaxID=2072580 RepID=A0A1W0WBA6_HYPEX|nr:putative 39S ribosomal protein L24, mitochondrial [Hypsibius exemplaris]